MEKYIFIDESGDPSFFGRHKRLLIGTESFQPYLIIGMIETNDRKALRKAVFRFIESIRTDKLYNSIPSVATEKGWYVHARSDHPEIRAKFFELLRQLSDYKAHLVIAKKQLNVFEERHNSNPGEFYFDVLRHLLRDRLLDDDCSYRLYLSQRGDNSLHRFEAAVADVLAISNAQSVECNMEIIPGREMPEFSIVDYLIWAVQRKLLTGENRFFDALEDKYGTIITLYEEEK